MEKEKIKKLIQLYENVLYGEGENMGLFDCYDPYYAGCWDDFLKEIDKLKEELPNKQQCMYCEKTVDFSEGVFTCYECSK